MFITEGLLTTLMCAPRSVYSWDVVITRAGGKLFFDRRDDSAVELLTTAETAPEVSLLPCNLGVWHGQPRGFYKGIGNVTSEQGACWQHQAASVRKESHMGQQSCPVAKFYCGGGSSHTCMQLF